MALKFLIESAAFDTLNDVEKTFYKKEGDNYQLEVEGAVDKTKLDEFRSNNTELMKQAKQFEGVDLEAYNNFKKIEEANKDKTFIEQKDFEGLVASRTKILISDFEGQIAALKQNSETSANNYTKLLTKTELEGAAIKAFSEHKINPDANESLMAQIRGKFSVENGQVVAKNGDEIEMGSNGNLTINEFVASQPEIFKMQSDGGKGSGATNQVNNNSGLTSTQRIANALKKTG